jgi:hypothetical protein
LEEEKMRSSKWLLVLVCAFVAVLPSVGNAAIFSWFGGNGAWENGANWDQAGAIPDDQAQVNQVSGICTISSAQKCFVSLIGFGVAGLSPTLDIQANGSLTQKDTEMIIGIAGGGPTAPGIVNVEGTATLASLRIGGEGTNNYGFMNINGGNVTVTAFGTYIGTRWDNLNTGIGTVNISNGGVFTINGMSAQGKPFVINTGSSVNLFGSTAVFKANGDWVEYMQGLIDAGKITGRTEAVLMNDGYTYVVPEPMTMVLLGLGGLLIRRK